jgi:cytidine deaminase
MTADRRDELVDVARRAREHARAGQSGFKVGAALLTKDGKIYTGCNVENATYALTVCAERTALLKALSEGEPEDHFAMIAVVAAPDDPTPPCGPCRQLLWEYCHDIPVVMANLTRITKTVSLADLLPLPFDGRLLK